MIRTPTELKNACQNATSFALKKPTKVSLSRKMARLLDQWQMANRFPSLLFLRQGGASLLVRVR